MEAQRQFISTGRSAGNENCRWHGTGRICNIDDKGPWHTQFCSAPTCSLLWCCIMPTSFDVSLWGKKTGWGRRVVSAPVIYFIKRNQKWQGIYTSSTFSKSVILHLFISSILFSNWFRSNDYSHNDCKFFFKSNPSPPAGYDSVSLFINQVRWKWRCSPLIGFV